MAPLCRPAFGATVQLYGPNLQMLVYTFLLGFALGVNRDTVAIGIRTIRGILARLCLGAPKAPPRRPPPSIIQAFNDVFEGTSDDSSDDEPEQHQQPEEQPDEQQAPKHSEGHYTEGLASRDEDHGKADEVLAAEALVSLSDTDVSDSSVEASGSSIEAIE